MSYTLGIDIGGTKIAGGVVSTTGQVSIKRVAQTPSDGAMAVLEGALELSDTLIVSAAEEGRKILAIGIGAGGIINANEGTVLYASDILPGWAGTSIASAFQERFHLPVVVENDVNALALGEHHFGAGRHYADVLYVAVGTGIGGAIVRNGELWRGATWSAGELGHLTASWDDSRLCSCGATGCVEAYSAGPAMSRRYCELSKITPPIDLYAVVQRAEAGDALAKEVITEGAHILGRVLAGLLNVIDPQALVIGGGVAELKDLWWKPLEDALRANRISGPAGIPIYKAELGVDAAFIGAAFSAHRKTLEIASRDHNT